VRHNAGYTRLAYTHDSVCTQRSSAGRHLGEAGYLRIPPFQKFMIYFFTENRTFETVLLLQKQYVTYTETPKITET